jgi:glyoxylase-like metal-dependent hydrolase (beta-lactamase superfamily II)
VTPRRLPRILWTAALVATAAALLAVLAAALAPYLYAELGLRQTDALVRKRPEQPVRGAWFGDYFIVETLDATTFAIGEPRYYQLNYSYLIVGTRRAVLFDAGTGNRDIVPVVRSLTKVPVTVIPSHLHFDHVGALGRFDHTALVDMASLRKRADADDGTLQLGRYEFLGFADGLPAPRFAVDEWWFPGTDIDLGGRSLKVLHTPGHTPSSASLYDAERHRLFAGDLIYSGKLPAFLPGASRRDYLKTTRRLLETIDPGTIIYAAHVADDPVIIGAPVLEVADLRALEATLVAIDSGAAISAGSYPRIFPVRGPITFATGFAWNNR